MAHKLLCADDSVTVQRAVAEMFANENVQVIVVGDGRQAIERTKSERPDIVLADIGMPERDGYEVAAFIKGDARLGAVPVLLMAGAQEPVDEARARTIGCAGVLRKPFEAEVVVSRVRELLAASGAPVSRAGNPVDEYFDKLDAAFSTLGTTGGLGQTPERSAESGADVRAAAEPGAQDEGRARPLATAFAAMLAVEEGRAPAPPPAAPPVLSEATIDEIARRVIARMGDESMRRLVADVAERLVREEIARIKRIRDDS